MPTDPSATRAAAAARRKADLLMASALVREQATLALDDIDLRTRAWEDRVRQLRDRAAAGAGAVGRALASGQPAWVRPLAVAGVAAWLVARLRRGRGPAGAEAQGPSGTGAGRPPRAGSSWAAGSLLLVNLPRLIRWSRRARVALQLARLLQARGQGRARDSAKSRRPRS